MDLIFLRPEDFRTRIKDSIFSAMIEKNGIEVDVQEIELAVIEEISSYLRGSFEVAKIFALQTDESGATLWQKRNQLIVVFAVDMVLYHLAPRLNINAAAIEKREERYTAAVAWLKAVNAGKVLPDLPRLPNTAAEPGAQGQIRWTAKPPRR